MELNWHMDYIGWFILYLTEHDTLSTINQKDIVSFYLKLSPSFPSSWSLYNSSPLSRVELKCKARRYLLESRLGDEGLAQ